MKRYMLMASALVLTVVLVLSGCDLLGGGDGDPTAYIFDGIRVNDGSTTTYYSLYVDFEDPDNPVSAESDTRGAANTDWEIMVVCGKEILTNSGVTATAEGSGGFGGVVFSGNTDFDTKITAVEAAALFAADPDDGQDYEYWAKTYVTSGDPADPDTGNDLCFPGFKNDGGRDGLSASTAWAWMDNSTNKAPQDIDFSLGTAYAEWERMKPNFSNFTNNVYVVRSGDGSAYYKIQIIDASYLREEDVPVAGGYTTHYTYKMYIEQLQ
jgi:hypothetical protein